MDSFKKDADALEAALSAPDHAGENPDDEWNESIENVLVEWAERSQSYRLMHEAARELHTRADKRFTLPVIFLSAIAGGGNLSMGALLPPEDQTMANTAVGVLGLTVGIIGALSNYMRHGPLSESHKNSAFTWGKLAR